MKFTETACVSDELCRLLKKKKKKKLDKCIMPEWQYRQIVSLGDSRIKRVRDRIAFLSMLTVRVVVLEYSQLHKKA